MTWFTITKISDRVYCIREQLGIITDKFHTKYTNLYLILGEDKALLFDTGIGLENLSQIIQPFVKNRELLVFNSHHHFDHTAGNKEFPIVQIHKLDYLALSRPYYVDDINENGYFSTEKINLTSETIIPLIGDETFDLGNISVKVLSTPGHTTGSICLLTSEGDLFTGDTVHYGAVFLPNNDLVPDYLETLKELSAMKNIKKILPGHEEFPLKQSVIDELIYSIGKINVKESRFDEFLDANLSQIGNFLFVYPNEEIN